MKYCKKMSSVLLLFIFSTACFACVTKDDLQDARISKYTSAGMEEGYCPVAEKWIREGMCENSRKEKISIRKLNGFLSDYYENCK